VSGAQSNDPPIAQSNWLVRRLTRVTSGGRYIPALDGLRWLAMALVFLQHFQLAIVATTVDRSVSPDPGLRTLYDLRVGVELFFVISGFILGVPFVEERVLGKERVDLRAYFLRRLTRIEPPYAIALAIFTAGWLLVGRDPASTLRHALASLFYVHNLVYGAFHPQAINMVTWSLEIEVQFYLLRSAARAHLPREERAHAALRARVVHRALGRARRARAPRRSRASALDPHADPLLRRRLPARGSLRGDWKTEPSTSWHWDLVAIPAWCALPFVATAPIPMKDLAIATALFVAFVASFRSVGTRTFLGWTPVRLLGGMCYSIYLFHYLPVMFGWHYVFAADLLGAQSAHGARWIDTLAYGGLMFALLFPLFLAYYLAVEHPFMSNRWWKRLMPHPR
jgi:peptidoglycan/LPS O-acetylase OafA/YrhL